MAWDDHPWALKLGYIALAFLGGAIGHVMQQNEKGEKASPWRVLLEAIGSGFVGFLVYLVCQAFKVGPEWTGVIVGVCGWLGASVTIRMLQKFVNKRLGVDNDD